MFFETLELAKFLIGFFSDDQLLWAITVPHLLPLSDSGRLLFIQLSNMFSLYWMLTAINIPLSLVVLVQAIWISHRAPVLDLATPSQHAVSDV